MKIPKAENFKNDSLYETKKISNIKKFDSEYTILNDKDKVKLIKTIEKIVRSSLEYKEYIIYLKDMVAMNRCSFFTNLTSKSVKNRVSIEMHHEPFTLFDICQIVLEKHITEFNYINPLKIAEEVMKVHYQNKIGLIPLSVTVHQLVTCGKLSVPLQCVYGDYCKFIEEYKPYISNQLHDILYVKLQMSKDISQDMSILEKKYVYLDTEMVVEKVD